MAYFTKEQYEAKERYAERRNKQNAEKLKEYFIKHKKALKLTQEKAEEVAEEVADALAEIARYRHKLHSSQEHKSVIFGNPTPAIDYFTQEIEETTEKIKKYISPKATIKPFDDLSFYIFIEDYTAQELFDELPKNIQNDYKWIKSEEEDDQMMYVMMAQEAANSAIMDAKNKEIEKYLENIDKKTGTQYAPTGHARAAEYLLDL